MLIILLLLLNSEKTWKIKIVARIFKNSLTRLHVFLKALFDCLVGFEMNNANANLSVIV